MAKTNFQIFNEENTPERTYNDSEYKEATQRVGGVMPGMALSRMHNKMYYQWSAMCKAIANLIVNHGHDCMDSDVNGITRYLEEAIVGAATTEITAHRTAAELDHPEKSVKRKHLADNVYTLPAPEATNAARFVGGDHKVRDVTPRSIGAYSKGEINNLLAQKAPLASPALTGTPTVPTAGRGTNNGQIASTAFVAQAIAALVNSAPGALDTLQELARALGNDANFATTVTNALAGKLGKTEKAASAGNSDTLGGQSLQWIINQINAAKTGIVAGNLAQNGWVKFANGLIVQWGAIRNYEYNMFPVAYTQWVHVFLVAGISGNTPEDRSTTYGATLVGDPTLTKFYPLVGNTEYEGGVPEKTGVGRWMSIGV